MAAADWVARERSFERVAEAWEAALARCAARPAQGPRPGWPAHWRAAAGA